VWNNLTLRKNALDNMEFLDLTTSPTGAAAVGRMVWNADRETYQFGMDAALTQDIGHQSFAQVKNAESVTISNGMVVYISGASGDRATVKIASYSNDTLSARTIGIAAEDIGPNGTGFVVTSGPKYNQDTSAFSAGSMLWLGAYGNLTTNRPQAPLHGVFVGVAEKINANAGVVFVKVQNGFELDELHDVNVSTPATNDLLIYNGTVWTNYARTNLSGIYLPLAGGSVSGELKINYIKPLDSTGGTEGYINLSVDDEGIFAGPWRFDQQPTIPGYLTSTGAAATYLPLNGGTVTGSMTVARSTTAATVLTITNSGSASTGLRVDLGSGGTHLDLNQAGAGGGDEYTFSDTIANFHGNKITNAVIGGENLTNLAVIAGSGLGVTNNQLVVTNVAGTVTTNDLANYLPLAGGTMQQDAEIDMANGVITNIAYIGKFSTQLTAISFEENKFDGTWIFDQQPTIPGYVTTNGNAAGLTNFPSSLLSVSAGNTNYARRTTVPASNTAYGLYNQWALDNTNLYFYNAASSKWLKVNGTLEW
jgi:hypothetical protein